MTRPADASVRLSAAQEQQLRRGAAGEPEPDMVGSREGRAWWDIVGLGLLRRGTCMDAVGREVSHGWAPTAAGWAWLDAHGGRDTGADGGGTRDETWPGAAAATAPRA